MDIFIKLSYLEILILILIFLLLSGGIYILLKLLKKK